MNQDSISRLALSMHEGTHCEICKITYKTVDHFIERNPIYIGKDGPGKELIIACKECFEANVEFDPEDLDMCQNCYLDFSLINAETKFCEKCIHLKDEKRIRRLPLE